LDRRESLADDSPLSGLLNTASNTVLFRSENTSTAPPGKEEKGKSEAEAGFSLQLLLRLLGQREAGLSFSWWSTG
jgi:hypothetical protein